MNTPRQRPYRSAKRTEQAQETKQRVLAAARALFAERGYAATTLTDIAKRADVSVQTIYLTFGAKKALPITLLEELERRAGQDELPRQVSEASSPAEQVDIFAAFLVRLFATGADIIALALDAAASEPDIAELARTGDRRRLEGVRSMVRPWHESGVLKEGLSVGAAADIMWVLTDPALHRALVQQRRWSNTRYRTWLAQLLRDQVLADPGVTPTTGAAGS